jgi:hypothetical protein
MDGSRSAATRTRRLRHLAFAVVAAGGVAVAIAPPALAFTPAPHTQVPDLQKNNYAGKPLRVVTFVKADGHPHSVTSFDTRVIWFGHALVRSNWYKAASAAYQLGSQGSDRARRVTNMPTANNSMTAAILTSRVRGWAHAMGMHKNTAVRTIYVIYLPCVDGTHWSISKCGQNSFHPQLTQTTPDPDFTPGDSMAVINLPTDKTPVVDSATGAASHEIIEGATDSDHPGWRMHAADPNNPFDVSPWIYNENQAANTEVMDMSGGSRITQKFVDAVHGYSYRYERVFTNKSANADHDPFVPASPLGYASVSNSTNGWVRQSSAHSTHKITLTAWSTKSVPNWTLSTTMAAWKGGNATTPTVDRCSASLSRKTVNNGTGVTLTITYTGSHTARYWCVVKIRSTTAGASATGTTNDRFRQWLVGLRLEPPA